MTIIHTVILQRLRNAELIEFLLALLGIVNGDAVVKAAVAAQYATLDALVQQLNTLFVNDPASQLTAELTALDDTRDHLITGLTLLCQAHTYSPDEAMRAAAQILSRSLGIYGSRISAQSYNEESTTIARILDDWSTKPEQKDAAARLNTGSWTAALNTANESFRTKYAQRTADAAAVALSAPDTMKAKRGDAIAAFGSLRDKIVNHYGVNDGAAPWSTIAAQINALIDQYAATLTNRAAHAGKSDSGGGESKPQG